MPWGLAARLAALQVSARFPVQQYGAMAKSRRPTPARGDAAGREVGSRMPRSGEGWQPGCAFKSKLLACHPPDAAQRPGFALLLLFSGTRPGLAVGWGHFGRRRLHSPCLGFPGFRAAVSLLGPTGSWLQGQVRCWFPKGSAGRGARWTEQGVLRMARGSLEWEPVAAGAGMVAWLGRTPIISRALPEPPVPPRPAERTEAQRETGLSLPLHQPVGLGTPLLCRAVLMPSSLPWPGTPAR